MTEDDEEIDELNTPNPGFLSETTEQALEKFEANVDDAIAEGEQFNDAKVAAVIWEYTEDQHHEYRTEKETGEQWMRGKGEKDWRKMQSTQKPEDIQNVIKENFDEQGLQVKNQENTPKETKKPEIQKGAGDNEKPAPKPKRGLSLKKTKKLDIAEGDLDLNELTHVIGPKYILRHIINPAKKEELPETPEDPFLFAANRDTEAEEEEEEERRRIAKIMNQGALRKERTRVSRDKKNRFLTKGNKRGRKGLLHNRRGLWGQKLGICFLAGFLPRFLKPFPHRLETVGGEIHLHSFSASLKPMEQTKFLYLRTFDTGPRMSFNVINTVKKLDEHAISPDKTILLQWSQTGKPRVRNIRVDGIDDDFSRLERIALFVDRNYAKVRKIIYDWRVPIFATILVISAVFSKIFIW